MTTMQNAEEPQEDYLQLRRNISEEAPWKQMQKTTFTRWANEHLKPVGEQIVNLERDLSDGLLLTTLLEVLSKKELGTKEMLRHKKLDIVTKALKFLEQSEKIRLVSIDSVAIVDGKLKLILGLMWQLITHYSICMPSGSDKEIPEERNVSSWLLDWINTKVKRLKIRNYTSDWRDGRAIGALVDAVAPGLCPEWEDWSPKEAETNIRVAMESADEWLGVAQLISPEDLLSSELDQLSMMTYLSQFQRATLRPGAPLRARVRVYGPGLDYSGNFVDEAARFTVETFSAGTLDISVLDQEGKCIERSTVFRNDGKHAYVCNYVPQTDGEFQVTIKYNEREILKSPFKVMVRRGTNKEKLLQQDLEAAKRNLIQEQSLSKRQEEEISELTEQLSIAKETIKQWENEMGSLRKTLVASRNEIELLAKQLNEEKENSDWYEEHNRSLMEQSFVLTDKSQHYEDKIRMLTDELSKLELESKSQVEKTEAAYTKLLEEKTAMCKEHEHDIKCLEGELTEAKIKLKCVQENSEQLNKQLVQHQGESEKYEKEIKLLREQSVELQNGSDKYEHQTLSLKEQVADLQQNSKQQLEELDTIITKLTEEETRSENFQRDILSLEGTLYKVQENTRRLEEESENLERQFIQCKEKSLQDGNEIKHLKEVLLEGQEISSQYLVEIKSLEEQLAEVNEKTAEYEAFIKSLETQLLKQHKKCTDFESNNKNLADHVRTSMVQLQEKDTEIRTLSDKVVESENKLKTYEQDIDNLMNQLSEKQSKSEHYEGQIKLLKQISIEEKEKSETIEYELVFKNNQILEEKETSKQKEKELKSLENELQKEREISWQHAEKVSTLNKQLTDEQSKSSDLIEHYKQLKNQQDTYAQTILENKVLSNQLLESRRKIAEYEKEISRLNEISIEKGDDIKQQTLQSQYHKDRLLAELEKVAQYDQDNEILRNDLLEEKQRSNGYKNEFEKAIRQLLYLEDKSNVSEQEIKCLKDRTLKDQERIDTYIFDLEDLRKQLIGQQGKTTYYKDLLDETERKHRGENESRLNSWRG